MNTSVTRVLLAGNDREDVRRGVCEYARRAGWMVITGPPPHTSPRKVAGFWNVSGVIVGLLATSPVPWHRTRLPVVSLAYQASLRVTADHRAIGRLAARHFLEESFANLAYVYVAQMFWIDRQLEGFEQAVRRAGKQMHLLDWASHSQRGWRWQTYRRWVSHQLAALPKPVGVLLDSDWMAVETLEACLEAGLAVPEEVALVGVGDNREICEAAPVPLSSVRFDAYQEGYQAAKLLDARMCGRQIGRREILIPPAGLSVRQSSNIIAVPHLPTARALRYIWDHMAERDLSPQKAAAFVGLSRKTLNRNFVEYLGVSVAHKIAASRLTQAEILLAKTKETVIQAARETGFTSHLHLRRTFRRLRGIALQDWRRDTALRS